MKWHVERYGETVLAKAENGLTLMFTATQEVVNFANALIEAAEGPDNLDKIDEELGECE